MGKVKISKVAERRDAKALTLDVLRSQTPEVEADRRVWHLDFSKLWYLTEEQGKAYMAIDASKEYSIIMHDAETDCIERNLAAITAYMSDKASFFDLGCGEARKSIKITSYARQHGKNVELYAVDINKTILDTARANANNENVPVHTIVGDFEHLGKIIEDTPDNQRIFNLGANLVNFEPKEILGEIASNMYKGDVVYFSAQRRHNIRTMLKGYDNTQMQEFAFGTLQNVGFERADVEFGSRFNSKKSRVEIYFTVNNVPELLQDIGMSKGDEILIVKSLKPSLKWFREIAETFFRGEMLFNENKEYMAFVGYKKGMEAEVFLLTRRT